MKRVCVTGAGGYIGSWVVKLLLSKGYMVHGTVRDPCDEEKNGHLKKLEDAEERLHLFKADLLDYESLCAAFAGCSGVLHVASPVPLHVASTVPGLEGAISPIGFHEEDAVFCGVGLGQLAGAIDNTTADSWISSISVSSFVSVSVEVEKVGNFSESRVPPDMELDESYWTDIEYAKSTENWYAVSKTAAEMEALNFAERHDVRVVTICPSLVIGPMLQSTINATSLLLLSYMKEEGRTGGDTMENINRPYTDVRDLSDAILLLYENPESDGRYICCSYSFRTKEFVAKMESLFPGYNYPKIFTEKSGFAPLNSKKLLKLGWHYRPLEETIVDNIKNYEEAGLLEKGKPFPSTVRF
ncbi:hypothetical protein L1987_32535 [Smallanthus sonchifolius]|uniref:Uncharacterized protein n=1 Tax=Smallanthus sonchifolius TaxID=185202 RepID=A0ACB9HNA8_9ASTR|nr:hypothetical protein L1987_32535 [Smallanthus sonchifolius]